MDETTTIDSRNEIRKRELEAQRIQEEALLTSEPRQLWSSVQELEEHRQQTLEVRGREMAAIDGRPKASVAVSQESLSISRRGFLQWMGAASALMTGSACQRRPKDLLVPYVNKPQGYIMGVPVWYASVAPQGYGVLVKTREGKPIKLEGNPDHPLNKGGLDIDSQSELLNLFNPERLKSPKVNGLSTTWEAVSANLQSLQSLAPGRLRFLTGPVFSPSTASALTSFVNATKGKHHVLLSCAEAANVSAAQAAFRDSSLPNYRYDQAEVVVSVDADFLGADELSASATKLFSSRRKVHRGSRDYNRLFVFESMLTVTGVAADHRVSITPSMQLGLLRALHGALVRRLKLSTETLGGSDLSSIAKDYRLEESLLNELVESLVASRGKSIVLSGGFGPQSHEARLAAFAINALLGNIGQTVISGAVLSGAEGAASYEDLMADMQAGQVDTLIVAGVNPAYETADFSKLATHVRQLIVLSREENETTSIASLVLPESHFLEVWADSQRMRNSASIQQPVIEPLFASKSLLELLLFLSGSSQSARDYVEAYWKRLGLSGSRWADSLKRGFISSEAASSWRGSGRTSFQAAAVAAHLRATKALVYEPSKLELVVYRSHNLKEGQAASNAWLQELPDPISKVTWNNFAALSPELAKQMKLKEDLRLGSQSNDVIRMKTENASVDLAVHMQPGLRSNVVAVALGYGRRNAGTLGTNVGVYIRSLVDQRLWTDTLKIEKTGAEYALATTQRHFELHGRDRDILRQVTLKDFIQSQTDTAAHGSHDDKHAAAHFSLYNDKEFVYPNHKWGMVIDLNSCTGCNACVVACYSENNIGVVGEDEIFKGRHMAWMRLDLYYTGAQESPEAAFQPMLCQQCDLAPCETVCPVLATVHSADGLNDMVYNRCVGTRYCANNCPYKVRRFNFFNYTNTLAQKMDFADPLPLLLNPDVTVRGRGVMEKCTFCVQRIRRGVDEAKHAKQPLVDGAIQTACQQSCPADAIVFGDMNNPESEVAKLSQAQGKFKVLEIVNTRPSVTYLPRVRNKGLV